MSATTTHTVDLQDPATFAGALLVEQADIPLDMTIADYRRARAAGIDRRHRWPDRRLRRPWQKTTKNPYLKSLERGRRAQPVAETPKSAGPAPIEGRPGAVRAAAATAT